MRRRAAAGSCWRIPFVLILLIYIIGSAERRAANPDDKLLPPISEMAETTKRLAAEPDRRSGDYVLWADTAASLQRLALGLGISTLIGLGLRADGRAAADHGRIVRHPRRGASR